MAFIDELLQEPSYGWKNKNGILIKPSTKQLWQEALGRINIFSNRKNWISFTTIVIICCLLPVFFLFVFKYFSFTLLIAFIAYSMVIMGTHGTIWFHRYSTHKSHYRRQQRNFIKSKQPCYNVGHY